ncbi:MAG: LamG domain-containing protein [Candidatus Aenigmatarchaeota archaeon]
MIFIDYSYPRTLKITIPGVVQTKQVGKENSDPSLIGYWKFDEGSGTIAYDSSIYGNDGQLVNNPQWVDGKYGKALQFNGVNTYVNIGKKPSLNNLSNPYFISFEAYINRSENFGNTKWFGIVGTGQYLKPYYRLNYYHSPTENKYTLCGILNTSKNGYKGIYDNQNIPPNTFTYVAFTYDGILNKTYLYQNGINTSFDNNNNFGGTLYNSPLDFLIGVNDNNIPFNGTIDEVRVWNRPLTPEEVLNHYLHGPV